MRGAIAAILLASAAAHAEPPNSCRDLAASKLAKLPVPAQDKVSGATTFETGHEAKFATLQVTIAIARGPQLVREILLACPGALDVIDVSSNDSRHFTSTVRMHVKSFATVARMIQMPAVQYVSIFDPSAPRPMIPEPIRDFE